MNFESIQIGDSLGPEDLVINKGQVREFAATCGLNAPRFMDDEGARAEGLPGIILPGNMSLGLVARLVTDWLGPDGGTLARIGTTYRSPVLPERSMTMQGFVTNRNEALRTVEIDVWIDNEDGERMVIATATVKFSR